MKTKALRIIGLCFIGLCHTLLLKAQAPYGNAGDHTAVPLGSSEAPFGYYEYLPLDFNSASTNTYPLVLFYHGYGERGNGTANLHKVLLWGPPKLVQDGSDFEAIIISPQGALESGTFSADDFLNLYNYLIANYPIDINRVYVTGLSAGGGGTWNALEGHYDKIAAAVPICGTSVLNNPSDFLQQTPIWTHHNFDDDIVVIESTISKVNAIANIGNSVMAVYPYGSGNSASDSDYSMQFDTNNQTWSAATGANEPTDKLSFTLYKDGGHNSWTKTYDNQEMWDWMFAQSLNSLSIDEEVIDFKLYPNPTSETFTISAQNETEKTIEIYDLFGSKIYNNQFSKELTVDVSTYSSGVYFAKVIDGNSNEKVMKVIVN